VKIYHPEGTTKFLGVYTLHFNAPVGEEITEVQQKISSKCTAFYSNNLHKSGEVSCKKDRCQPQRNPEEYVYDKNLRILVFDLKPPKSRYVFRPFNLENRVVQSTLQQNCLVKIPQNETFYTIFCLQTVK
jgi:hypothetical protein